MLTASELITLSWKSQIIVDTIDASEAAFGRLAAIWLCLEFLKDKSGLIKLNECIAEFINNVLPFPLDRIKEH